MILANEETCSDTIIQTGIQQYTGKKTPPER